MNKVLTPKQKAFTDYYIELGNGTEAYIKAGYNKKGARANSARLIANDSIKQYIEERLAKIEDARIAKGEEVLQYLTKVMRGEEKDQFGLDASLQDRTKAAELLGKRYRLFVDKVEADVNQTVVFTGEDELED
ncbi:terminase small subunit [Clostridium sp. CTA-7]